MLKYQNYKHYKLPITINPLDYGKLILKIEELNIFIIQINRTNIALIFEYELFNHIKLFREGDFIFEYNDHKIDELTFVRSLNNKKFTFKNNELSTIDFTMEVTNLIIFTKTLGNHKNKPDIQPWSINQWKT